MFEWLNVWTLEPVTSRPKTILNQQTSNGQIEKKEKNSWKKNEKTNEDKWKEQTDTNTKTENTD
jgi:hypothetical protein